MIPSALGVPDPSKEASSTRKPSRSGNNRGNYKYSYYQPTASAEITGLLVTLLTNSIILCVTPQYKRVNQSREVQTLDL